MTQKNQYNIVHNKEGYWEQDNKYWDSKQGKICYGISKGFYINGRKDGEWIACTVHGNPFRRTNYKNDKMVGKIVAWYKDSVIEVFNGQYDNNNLRCGTWHWFYDNGSRRQTEIYDTPKEQESPRLLQSFRRDGLLGSEILSIY